MDIKNNKTDYNEEPVFFCSDCFSLKIERLSDDMCYCKDCGSGSIESASIEQWDKLYRSKWGLSFMERHSKKTNHKYK